MTARSSKTRVPLWVVAAALVDRDGRWLVQRRPLAKQHGGLWEFPGGKVEEDEPPRAALRRELAEELGIDVDTAAMVPHGFAEGGAGGLLLLLYRIGKWSGDPRPLAASELRWCDIAALRALPMPPGDRKLVDRWGVG